MGSYCIISFGGHGNLKLLDYYRRLDDLKINVITTRNAAVYLNISNEHASQLLSRLVDNKLIIRLKSGLWGFVDRIEPLMLPELLTAPLPSYISLQTALYYHGMISQIPVTIYAVSLARTKKYQTALGTVSIHHIQPSFFRDYTELGDYQVKMATPEKALIDILYLSPGKSYLFKSLPEIELPRKFNIAQANRIIKHIVSVRRRTLVEGRFSALMEKLS